MNFDQAWQTVLGQLQMEMPRASFDTWVRDTRALSLNDGAMTVGVRNAYARDWLDSRLASTVNRLLIGILDSNVTVSFVVAQDDEIQEINESSDDSGEAVEKGNANDAVNIQAEYSSRYEQITKPDTALVINGYFKRLLKEIGPELACLVLAFRQLAYFLGAKAGTVSGRFSVSKLSMWSGGISVRTIKTYLQDPKTWEALEGLVRPGDTEPRWQDGMRLPNQYFVEMSLPLTAADVQSLTEWFLGRLRAGDKPEDVLVAALEASRDELIPLGAVAKEGYKPRSVEGLLVDLFGDLLDKSQLEAYAARLRAHLMPLNDLIYITHFFIRNVWPHLNPGPGWLVVLLRDLCWVDKSGTEARDTVVVKGGWKEIAGWLGLSRAKTIWEWFYQASTEKSIMPSRRSNGARAVLHPGKLKNPVLGVYVSEIGRGENITFGHRPLVLKVFLQDLPFEVFDAVLGGAEAVQDLEKFILGWDEKEQITTDGKSGEKTCSVCGMPLTDGASCTIRLARFAPSVWRELHHPFGAICAMGLARFAPSAGANCTIRLARFASELGAICLVKALESPSPSLKPQKDKTPPTSSTSHVQQDDEDSPSGEVVHLVNFSEWDLERIFEINKVNHKTRKLLRETGATAMAFVSWLLFACSQDTEAKGILKPLGWTLNKLFEYPIEGKNKQFDALASIPPRELVGLLSGESPISEEWAGHFAALMMDPTRDSWNVEPPTYRELLPILLGEEARSKLSRTVKIRKMVRLSQ